MSSFTNSLGNDVIRFDSGARTGHQPHINLDPRGYPSKKNPHIYVPKSVINSAPTVQKFIEYGGAALSIAAVASDITRLGSAAKDDYDIYQASSSF